MAKKKNINISLPPLIFKNLKKVIVMRYAKEKMRFYQYIDRILDAVGDNGIDIPVIVLQVEDNFGISERTIMKRIELLEKTGIIKRDKDWVCKIKKEDKEQLTDEEKAILEG